MNYGLNIGPKRIYLEFLLLFSLFRLAVQFSLQLTTCFFKAAKRRARFVCALI